MSTTVVSAQYPIQCIQYFRRTNSEFVVASAGCKIFSYDASTGSRLGVWPEDDDGVGHVDPSEKQKRRLFLSSESNEKKEGSSHVDAALTWSTIPLMVASSDGRCLVVLTAEDKAIRVLSVEKDGMLRQQSVRNMPKRPCAVAFADEDSTIIVGDKFGDVYAMPLQPDSDCGSAKHFKPLSHRSKQFQPSATALTVHTKRNLAALEQQLRQSSEQHQTASDEKSSLDFEHQAILGHVSMLTDLVLVSLPKNETSTPRQYLLTADRDEHIRVSRGPPQSHVIESYCLGHTSFISKLCIPPWAPQVLISGGGDNFLLVWKWAESNILQKMSLTDETQHSNTEIIVRGIWAFSAAEVKIILVGLERSAKLLCFAFNKDGTLTPRGHIPLCGNVLGLASIESTDALLVSVDNVHPAEIRELCGTQPHPASVLVQSFRLRTLEELDGWGWRWEPSNEPVAMQINQTGTTTLALNDEKQLAMLDDALYHLGNLRKRSQADDE